MHVFEFEDASWFPPFLRRAVTDLIVVANRTFGVTAAIEGLIRRIHSDAPLQRIVDLGSGTGGSMPEVITRLRQEGHDLSLVLTDLYPNVAAMTRFEHGTVPGVAYHAEALDATACGAMSADLYTMVNGFHHMTPDEAGAILCSAVESKTPILIVEVADNRLPFWVWLAFLPLGFFVNTVMALLFTLQIRPISVSRLFFTYCVPIIPFFFAWDGQASYPRIYGFDDLDRLVSTLETDAFVWEKEYAKPPNGKGMAIYLYGCPKAQ